jgi:hypothetical protein
MNSRPYRAYTKLSSGARIAFYFFSKPVAWPAEICISL